MISIYYTGAQNQLQIQTDPSKSIGGYVSTSPIPNNSIDNLFPGYDKTEAIVRGVAIKNIGSTAIGPSISLWMSFDETKVLYEICVSNVAVDNCGQYVEFLANEESSPLNATAWYTATELNKLIVNTTITPGSCVVVWIKRTIQLFGSAEDACVDQIQNPISTTPVTDVLSIEY